MKRIFILLSLLLTFSNTWAQFKKNRDRVVSSQDNALNYANPAQYTIGGIEVTGLNILDKNAMVSLTGLKVGDKIKIPGDAISNAIRNLWKHGLVGDVTIRVDRVEGQNVFLTIVLAERPRLTGFYFTGISKGKETGLKDELKLIRGRIVTDAMIRNTETAVRKHFVKKGFLNTEVKITQENDTLQRDGIRLKIAVAPKSKVKIHRISFAGNDNMDDATLKMKLKGTHEYPRFTLHRRILEEIFGLKPKQYFSSTYDVSPKEFKEFLNNNVKLNLFTTSKFIASDFEDDKKKLIEFYNSKGYRDAEIVSDSVYAYNDRTVNVDFKVYEGPKYYFRNIIWKGNYVYTDRQLDAVLAISKGDVYNKELIDKKLQFNPKGYDISGLYMDDGYLFFQINPVEVAVQGDSIDVEMRIVEGEQATINEVTIVGNDRTSDHVIRRELSTIPGQKFRRSDIIRTQQKLGQLGYFAADKIGQNLVPNPANGTVDVEWQVEEQSNDQVELSGGWGGYYGFVGTLGLTFNNFSLRNITKFENWSPLPVGDGQRLSLRAQANGRTFQSYSASFTEPWLGGRKPQSLSVSYAYSVSRYSQNFYSARPSDLTSGIKAHNISVGLGRLLEWPDNYFTLTNSLSYAIYHLNNVNYGLGCTTCSSNQVALTTTLSRNSIDNPMYPGQGSSISLSLILTPPYSLWNNIDYSTASAEVKNKWQEYWKTMFDAKYYIPLDNKKKLVVEAKAHFGFISSYTSETGIGPFERFVLGGDGLAGGFNSFVLGKEIIGLRGYDNNTLTPPLYTTGQNQLGGVVYNKFGLELRYPVTTGNAATVYGFTFLEGGNNWDNYEDFNPFKMYRSAGFGARIFMPAFGLIGINWGYGFDSVPLGSNRSISGSHIHFSIGQQIR